MEGDPRIINRISNFYDRHYKESDCITMLRNNDKESYFNFKRKDFENIDLSDKILKEECQKFVLNKLLTLCHLKNLNSKEEIFNSINSLIKEEINKDLKSKDILYYFRYIYNNLLDDYFECELDYKIEFVKICNRLFESGQTEEKVILYRKRSANV